MYAPRHQTCPGLTQSCAEKCCLTSSIILLWNFLWKNAWLIKIHEFDDDFLVALWVIFHPWISEKKSLGQEDITKIVFKGRHAVKTYRQGYNLKLYFFSVLFKRVKLKRWRCFTDKGINKTNDMYSCLHYDIEEIHMKHIVIHFIFIENFHLFPFFLVEGGEASLFILLSFT